MAATGALDTPAIESTITSPIADPTRDAARPPGPATGTLTGNPLWGIPLRSLSVTRERPLFSPSRRPPTPQVVAAPPVRPVQQPKPAEPDHPLLMLMGTIVGENMGIGVFIDQATRSVIRLKTGQDHAGWTLRAVRDRETVFQKGQREATLVLPARGAADQAAAVPTPLPASARAGDTWMDGDGQLITPPPSPWRDQTGRSVPPPPATWTDGDGQKISPPPARTGQH